MSYMHAQAMLEMYACAPAVKAVGRHACKYKQLTLKLLN